METTITDSTSYVDSTARLYGAIKTSLTAALPSRSRPPSWAAPLRSLFARYRFRLAWLYRTLNDHAGHRAGIALLIFFITVGMNLSVRTIIIGIRPS